MLLIKKLSIKINHLSLHDTLPIYINLHEGRGEYVRYIDYEIGRIQGKYYQNDPTLYNKKSYNFNNHRSEEHTSELQTPCNIVCRLLLKKTKKMIKSNKMIKKNDNI